MEIRRIEDYIECVIKESTPERPIWNQEQLRSGGSGSWNYVNTIMMRAFMDQYQKMKDQTLLAWIESFVGYFVMEDGTIRTYQMEDYNLDHLCGGCLLLDLYKETGKQKYRLASELLAYQLNSQPRTSSGSFWHKKIYERQVWLDGLYMAQPFYMRYGAEKYDAEICRDSVRQFFCAESVLKDKKTGLYYHGYDETGKMFWSNSETGTSSCFWLRAAGWFAMACLDVLLVMPEELVEEKKRLKKIFTDFMDAVKRYQDPESGMWYQVMDQGARKGNYLETSGTAIFSYVFMKGARCGLLDEMYRIRGEQAFKGIMKYYFKEEQGKTALGGICLVAGLGGAGFRRDGSYEYYISEPVVENDGKGLAPFLLAYHEMCFS